MPLKELPSLANSKGLIDTLLSKVPAADEAKGVAVFHNAAGEVVYRTLDLRALSQPDEALFWKALKMGMDKLSMLGSDYSHLNPARLKELLELRFKMTDNS